MKTLIAIKPARKPRLKPRPPAAPSAFGDGVWSDDDPSPEAVWARHDSGRLLLAELAARYGPCEPDWDALAAEAAACELAERGCC